MPIPHNISKDHLLKAINKIDNEGIPKGADSQYYDVLFSDKLYPPKLIVSYANFFANGVNLDRDSFAGGLNTPCFKLLEENGFKIIPKQIANLMRKIKLYDIHGVSASSNYKSLITNDHKYFYWDNKKFSNYELGDIVFWVNRLSREILFTEIDKKDIIPTFDNGRNTINDDEYVVFANANEGQFELFYRFKILKKTTIPLDWNYKDPSTFASQTMALILFEEGVRKQEGRISKITDLMKLFSSGEAYDLLYKAKNILESNMVLKNPSVTIPTERNQKSPKDIIHIHEYLNNKGFQYNYEEIANFYLSLKTKPFVILAGISGTGKTQLPRMFAEAINIKDNIRQVPVRPDWTDGSDLLGYTSLEGKFVPKELTNAIKSAAAKPEEPFFFILDEMNLARVEHYFSDFLSVIETRAWENGKGTNIKTQAFFSDDFFRQDDLIKFRNLTWPKNLYLIGTVNMDETTHSFSRKVLDRANSIEMNDINLDWIEASKISSKSITNVTNTFLETEFLISTDLTDSDKNSIAEEFALLKKVNDILQNADLQFAYRVRDEVAFYLTLNKKYKLIEDKKAIDFQLVQKVLPRIHGSSERIQKVLIDLLNLLENKDFKSNSFQYVDFEQKVDFENLNYTRSSKKIAFMLKRFDDDRFTSFWL
jgi:energy-coupling factor transporter ATP-binding protein EcfA2